jgi:ribosomal protein L17
MDKKNKRIKKHPVNFDEKKDSDDNDSNMSSSQSISAELTKSDFVPEDSSIESSEQPNKVELENKKVIKEELLKQLGKAELLKQQGNAELSKVESSMHTSSEDTNLIFKTKVVKTKKKANDKDKMIKKLLSHQLDNVPHDRRLMFKDMKRICKNIVSDMFDEKKCCIWQGHITNMNNKNKGRYVNFYFCGKKRALHRLLYCNFIDKLTNDEYLKFICENKGVCCNVNHLEKFKYQNKNEDSSSNEDESDEGEHKNTKNKQQKKKYEVIIKKSKNNKITLTFG